MNVLGGHILGVQRCEPPPVLFVPRRWSNKKMRSILPSALIVLSIQATMRSSNASKQPTLSKW
ncbi:hypothetical protein EON65_31585 [archaeon]|nr:MAG: hypothetical protein EON65_31585 [archaeon]